MKPKECLDVLKEEFGLTNQLQLAKFLDLTPGRVSQIMSAKDITPGNIRALLLGAHKAGQKSARSDTNSRLVDAFGGSRNLNTQAKIATALGKTQGAVAQWKNGHATMSKSILSMMLRAAAKVEIFQVWEMCAIEPGKPGGKWYLYHDHTSARRTKIMKKMTGRKGVYCFYDSLGHLTYVGKADDTTFDTEVEARLNAKVSMERVPYRVDLKKHPQVLRQGEIARFFSAYEVTQKEAIPLVEALLIRCTANSQFNNRLENVS